MSRLLYFGVSSFLLRKAIFHDISMQDIKPSSAQKWYCSAFKTLRINGTDRIQ